MAAIGSLFHTQKLYTITIPEKKQLAHTGSHGKRPLGDARMY